MTINEQNQIDKASKVSPFQIDRQALHHQISRVREQQEEGPDDDYYRVAIPLPHQKRQRDRQFYISDQTDEGTRKAQSSEFQIPDTSFDI